MRAPIFFPLLSPVCAEWVHHHFMNHIHNCSCLKVGEGLFTRACPDQAKENGCKLKDGVRSDIRKKFFTMTVVRHLGTGYQEQL